MNIEGLAIVPIADGQIQSQPSEIKDKIKQSLLPENQEDIQENQKNRQNEYLSLIKPNPGPGKVGEIVNPPGFRSKKTRKRTKCDEFNADGSAVGPTMLVRSGAIEPGLVSRAPSKRIWAEAGDGKGTGDPSTSV